MTQIKITITNGDKKAELEMSNADQLDKLLIIQSVFKLFEIELDVIETTREYKKIAKTYDGFFKSIQSEEPTIQTKQINTEDIAKQYEEGLTQIEEEKLETQYYSSGTKERDGQIVYLCRYECHVCNDRGNHYLPMETQEVRCRSCKTVLKVYPAHPDGFEQRDTHGNFMRAGSYKDWKVWD